MSHNFGPKNVSLPAHYANYDELVKKRTANEIPVTEEVLPDGGGFKAKGTRIVLSRLLYDPLKSREMTIENEIADHFQLIQEAEFRIQLNGKGMAPITHSHEYAWPAPAVAAVQLEDQKLPREGGGEIAFKYRIRFTGKDDALPAARRGVRVYAHKRLAAMPSLLAANTNMHGFRMTDYMDGVVHADFIDDEGDDYIATDRQTLRWESPLLAPLHEFLSEEIKKACYAFQMVRDGRSEKLVKEDKFTKTAIQKYEFSRRDERLAIRMASVLEGACKQGVADPIYKDKLPIILRGLGHGSIMTAISELAKQDHPELTRVAEEVARLTRDELDQFMSSVKGRLKALDALKKIVEAVDFTKGHDENTIQRMFEDCPWMIDPTYTQFLTANQPLDSMFNRLAKELKIWKYAPKVKKADDKRPDLVHLVGSLSLNRLVIVELKAPNLPLDVQHLNQLEYYMEKAEDWLKGKGRSMQIHGHLIGTKPAKKSKAPDAVVLWRHIEKAGADATWKVRDYLDVLAEAQATHHELISVKAAADKRDEEAERAEMKKAGKKSP